MSFSEFGQGERFDEWSRKIHDIMDEMQRRDFVQFRRGDSWRPSTNVYETREAYFICVELSGVDEHAIDVTCSDRSRITITGRREQPRPRGVDGPLSVHAMEIDEGRFYREVDLPEPIDVDRMEASYIKGYLWITAFRAMTE